MTRIKRFHLLKPELVQLAAELRLDGLEKVPGVVAAVDPVQHPADEPDLDARQHREPVLLAPRTRGGDGSS